MERAGTNFYVDGFNFYFGILNENPHLKWFDFKELCRSCEPRDPIGTIKFFTAIVDETLVSSRKRDRQINYLEAIRKFKGIEVIKGKMKKETFECKNFNCQNEDRSYAALTEKKTDVNIALQMYRDAVAPDGPKKIVLFSGDIDLSPALEMIKKDAPGISLKVYIPATPENRKFRRVDEFKEWAWVQYLDPKHYEHSVLPRKLTSKDGSVYFCPDEWYSRAIK